MGKPGRDQEVKVPSLADREGVNSRTAHDVRRRIKDLNGRIARLEEERDALLSLAEKKGWVRPSTKYGVLT